MFNTELTPFTIYVRMKLVSNNIVKMHVFKMCNSAIVERIVRGNSLVTNNWQILFLTLARWTVDTLDPALSVLVVHKRVT